MKRLNVWGKSSKNNMPVYIGIGSNMGNRLSNAQAAVEKIRCFPDTKLIAVSSFYETEPLELSEQEWFVNAVVAVHTGLSPEDLLDTCLLLEKQMGRKRSVRYGPRPLDLDLLLYGQQVVRTDRLEIPHPKLHLRRFVLTPLAEIAPEAIHPVLLKTTVEMLEQVSDSHSVHRRRISPPATLK